MTMYHWMAVTFGIGVILIIADIYLTSKRKTGITPSDKRRFWGIFWIAVAMSLLVGALVWLSEKTS